MLTWSKSNTTFTVGVVFFLLFIGSFWGGFRYGKKSVKCPTITHDTTIVHDTTVYTIPDTIPYYINGRDSIIYVDVPQVVDTSAILKDYFAKHIYEREWSDSSLMVNIIDTISQNKCIGNKFTYELLRPQTIINNTVEGNTIYNRYVYLGGQLSFDPATSYNTLTIKGLFAFDKGYGGVGYDPKQRIFSVEGGFKLFKFKKQ